MSRPSFQPDPILGDYLRAVFVRQVTRVGEVAAKRLLATFANIADEADAVANEVFERLGNQPGEGDMGDVAEAARDEGVDHYHALSTLEQAVKNLLAAGLYHVFEQQQKVFDGLCARRLGGTLDPHRLSIVAERLRRATARGKGGQARRGPERPAAPRDRKSVV